MPTTLHYTPKCSSTSDLILDYLSPETQHFALYCFEQTAGRGQYGNQWDNGAGQNLAYSLAIAADDFDLAPEWLNFKFALHFSQIIAQMTQKVIHIKWPNDLILNKKKIAGQLLELKKINGKSFYIIGFGLNVNQKNFGQLPKASSMALETHEDYDLHGLTQVLHHQILQLIKQKQSAKDIKIAIEKHLFQKDQVSMFKIKDELQTGIIRGLNPQGELLVELDDEQIHRFVHKSIEMVF